MSNRNRSIWRLERGAVSKVFAGGASGELIAIGDQQLHLAYRKLTNGWINGLAYCDGVDSLAVATSRGELFFVCGSSLETKASRLERRWLNSIRRIGSTETFVITTAEADVLIWDPRKDYLDALSRKHTDQVWDCSISKDGRLLITSGGNGELALWNLPECKHIGWLSRGGYTVTSVALLDNFGWAASVDMGGTLTIWDVNELRAVARFQAHDERIWAVDASKCERALLTVGADQRAVVWDTNSLHARCEFRLSAPSTAGVFRDHANQIVVGGRDGTICFEQFETVAYGTTETELCGGITAGKHGVVAYIKRPFQGAIGDYSKKMLSALDEHGIQYVRRDITDDPLREQSLIRLSGSPLFPQLYVGGRFVGGSELLSELFDSGAFFRLLERDNC